ncbi:MAG: YlmC/YmxH family sporulation protein [Firmicutes bacterium]|jgi:YlmC/YmxH family sporulation protein|nr:YlmC/YmxH family sporulation protein [Bacillota bacterium]
MLLSEIGDKEIVDLSKGSLHGKLWDAEMLFDERTGVIHSLLVPDFQSQSGIRMKGDLQLPWNSIIVVGEDLIIFKS